MPKRFSQNILALAVLSIVLLEVLVGVMAAPKGRKNNRLYPDEVMRLEAMKRCRSFACKGPQNRTYHILDLLHEQKHIPPASFPMVEPAYLVVQRCDGHAGCCQTPELTCVPKVRKLEEIVIYKKEVQGPGQLVKITVEQHRACECREVNKVSRDEIERMKPNISSYDESNS